MNALIRWCKFNVVGAMGMAVQLGSLALLNRLTEGHYLVATAVALELTLVHNFVWHLHYTWRDRRDQSALARPVRALSSFEWAGFNGGKPGPDAGSGARRAHSGGGIECDRNPVLLDP